MENMENGSGMPQGNGPIADGAAMGGPAPEQAQNTSHKGEDMGRGTTPPPGMNERRGMAALSYVGALCLIPLIFAKDSTFAQYHAKQGLVIAAGALLLNIVSGMLWRVPFGGALTMIISIVIIVVCIKGIMKALNGEQYHIPYVSEWAAKIHF